MKTFNTVAAKNAGMSDQEIQQFMAENKLQPSKQNWFTDGESGAKGAYNAFANVMNVPSYMFGGGLRGAFGTDYYNNPIEGMFRGVKDKAAAFNEVPRFLGMEEGSPGAIAVGLGTELLLPSTLQVAGPALKALGKKSGAFDLFAKKQKAGDALDDARKGVAVKQKVADKLYQASDDAVTKGLGRNKTTEKMLARLKAAGIEPSEFFDRYNLWSRDPDDVQKAIEIVDKKLNAIARESQKSVDVRDVLKMFDDEIARLSSSAVESDTAKIAQEVLAERKTRFLQKIQTNADGVATPLKTSLGDVYETASRAQGDIPQSAWNLGSADSAKVSGLKKTSGMLRDYVGKQTGGESQRLGQEMSALINLKKLTSQAQVARAGNQQLPLKSIAGAIAGGKVAGVPGIIGGFAANQIAQSPIGAKVASKGYRLAGDLVTKAPQLPKLGQKLNEFSQSLPKINPYINRAVQTGARIAPQVNRTIQEQQQRGVSPPVKSNMPTAESFYDEIRKKRGY